MALTGGGRRVPLMVRLVLGLAGAASASAGATAVFVTDSQLGPPSLLLAGLALLWTAAIGQLPIRLRLGGNEVEYLMAEAAAAKAGGDDARAGALTETALLAAAADDWDVVDSEQFTRAIPNVLARAVPPGMTYVRLPDGVPAPRFDGSILFADGEPAGAVSTDDIGMTLQFADLARAAVRTWSAHHDRPLVRLLIVTPHRPSDEQRRAVQEVFGRVVTSVATWRPGDSTAAIRSAIAQMTTDPDPAT